MVEPQTVVLILLLCLSFACPLGPGVWCVLVSLQPPSHSMVEYSFLCCSSYALQSLGSRCGEVRTSVKNRSPMLGLLILRCHLWSFTIQQLHTATDTCVFKRPIYAGLLSHHSLVCMLIQFHDEETSFCSSALESRVSVSTSLLRLYICLPLATTALLIFIACHLDQLFRFMMACKGRATLMRLVVFTASYFHWGTSRAISRHFPPNA